MYWIWVMHRWRKIFVSSKNILDKRASVLVEFQATKDKVILRHIWTFCFLSSPQLQSLLLSTVWWMWMEWKWMLHSQERWRLFYSERLSLYFIFFSSFFYSFFLLFLFLLHDEWWMEMEWWRTWFHLIPPLLNQHFMKGKFCALVTLLL